jgi:hypothetical protein
MPLRDYELFFSPDQVDNMAAAFETAWQELTASLGPAKSEEEIQTLRKKLAECIVISALDVSPEAPDEIAREALECLHEGHVMNEGEPQAQSG